MARRAIAEPQDDRDPTAHAGAVVLSRTRRRDPRHTTWTFEPSIALNGPVDELALLDRDGSERDLAQLVATNPESPDSTT
jgi:hypothetical protein